MSTRWRLAAPLAVVAIAVAATLGACGDDGSGGGAPVVITGAAAQRGEIIAEDQGCTNCHSDDGRRSTGPTWQGLAGSEVELDGGDTVIADAAYLKRSIVDPRSEVVAGFPNIMPEDYDDLSPAELDDLVAYLQELAEPPPG